MKRITFSILALFLCFAAASQTPAEPVTVPALELLDAEVKVYEADDRIEKVELLTPYMTTREADREYRRVVRTLQERGGYTRLNGGKHQALFMRGNDINNTVLVARLKSVFGCRVAVAYERMKED